MPELPDEIEIDITAELIDDGQKGSCSGCPAALAIMAATGARHASISPLLACIWLTATPDDRKDYSVPERLASFMVDFDAGREVHPGKHKLTAI